MKVQPYEEDETLYRFTYPEKKNSIEESPRKSYKSINFTVPKSNSHIVQASRDEIINDDTIISFINTLICGISIIQHNIYFNNNYEQNEMIIRLRIIIVALAIASVIWIIRRYQVKLMIRLIRYQVLGSDTLYSTGLYKPMLLEILLALLVTPPYFDLTFSVEMLGFTVEYSLSAVLVILSVAKMYVVFRLFGHYSEYTKSKAQNISKRHSVAANAYFALKCYIQDSPFIGIGGFFIFMSTISAVIMQICEEPDEERDGITSESNLRYFWDNLWTILYTTTTVGYGNLYPMTHLGRGICILACILGNMYLGMLLVAIHNKIALDDAQNLSYAWISRGYYSKSIKSLAKSAIRKAATLYLLSKKWGQKTVSRIKPNGIVVYKRVKIRNDLCSLTEQQYLQKLRIYKAMKNDLSKLKYFNRLSREVGKTEVDILYDFEDAVRVEFPKIVKNMKNKFAKGDLEASESFFKANSPMEQKSNEIKEFSKLLKRRVAHLLKRRSTMIMRNSEKLRDDIRSLTNFSSNIV